MEFKRDSRVAEAEKLFNSLPEDIQEGLRTRRILHTQKDLLKMSKLSDHQRVVVIETIRARPEKLLAEVIPEPMSSVTPEDIAALKLLLSGAARQRAALKGTKFTSADVRRLQAMTPVRRETVSGIIETGSVGSLKEAMDIVEQGVPKKTKAPPNLPKLRKEVDKHIAKLAQGIDAIGSAIGDRSRDDRDDCIVALKHLEGLLSRWLERYTL